MVEAFFEYGNKGCERGHWYHLYKAPVLLRLPILAQMLQNPTIYFSKESFYLFEIVRQSY